MLKIGRISVNKRKISYFGFVDDEFLVWCLNIGFTIIKELSFPPRIKHGVNSNGNPG